VQCDDVADLLGPAATGETLLPGEARDHVEQCLRCQAEMVQYRKLFRALRTMRIELVSPAPGVLAEILAEISEAGERRAMRSVLHGKKVAYISGIAAATAAAAGGAIVIAARSRRRLAS
jgi:hypothetical protein